MAITKKKITAVKISTDPNTQYDIDLPSDATPSIASLTTSGAVSIGGDLSVAGSADLNNVYTQNIASGKDDEYNLHLSAGDTITFTYSGYTGAQSYIDVPHGKGTSSSHDVLACKSDISALNIIGGTGTGATQQIQDGTSGTFDFTGKNPNATAIDSTLTGNINYGGTGNYATVFGGKAAAIGKRSLAQGTTTVAKGAYSHAEGDNSAALGSDSHAEGYATASSGQASHSEGNSTQAIGDNSHAEGNATISNAFGSHAEGRASTTLASVPSSGGGGSSDTPPASEPDKYLGYYSHAEGENTVTLGYASHSEGAQTKAYGHWSHAEGLNATTGVAGDRSKGKAAHASGMNTQAIGNYSFATGVSTSATGEGSVATGMGTESAGNYSFSTGYNTSATGDLSAAIGHNTSATGYASFAAGGASTASAAYSFSLGEGLEAAAQNQFVVGKYNSARGDALFAVGNGSNASPLYRSNAFAVLSDGRAKVQAAPIEDDDVVRKGDLGTQTTYSYSSGVLTITSK